MTSIDAVVVEVELGPYSQVPWGSLRKVAGLGTVIIKGNLCIPPLLKIPSEAILQSC